MWKSLFGKERMVLYLRLSNFVVLFATFFCTLCFLDNYGESFQFPMSYNYQKSSIAEFSTHFKNRNIVGEERDMLNCISRHISRNSELILYGKRKVPVQFRGGQGKGDIQQQRAQFEEIKKTTETMPVFTVLVRHAGGIPKWYPVAGFQGDGNSKAIVDAYIGDGFFSGILKDVYRQQIEASIAKSVFDQERKLIGDAIKQFPELKKVKFNLEFGFSIAYGPYNRKMGKNPAPTVLKKEMTKSIFQKASENFSLTLKETFGGKE